jgi:hypothetical protein
MQLNCAHWRQKSWFVYTPPALPARLQAVADGFGLARRSQWELKGALELEAGYWGSRNPSSTHFLGRWGRQRLEGYCCRSPVLFIQARPLPSSTVISSLLNNERVWLNRTCYVLQHAQSLSQDYEIQKINCISEIIKTLLNSGMCAAFQSRNFRHTVFYPETYYKIIILRLFILTSNLICQPKLSPYLIRF